MAERGSSRRASRKTVEADFNAAIDRLVEGHPRNEKLKRLAESGQLFITFATVALEAGRSRSLIAHKGCTYQNVRARVVLLMSGSKERQEGTVRTKLSKLSAQVENLKLQLRNALDAQLESFLARQKAEREAEKWRQAFVRLKEDGDHVVPIRKK